MEYDQLVEKVIGEIKAANVDAVFGQERRIGKNLIIPVGKIAYGWGGGGGQGEMEHRGGKGEGEHRRPGVEPEGAGMGIGIHVKPLGYIHATPDRVSYRPIVDRGRILSILGFFAGLALTGFVKYLGKERIEKGKAHPRAADITSLPERIVARVRSNLRKTA